MNRRGLLRLFGIGAAASTLPSPTVAKPVSLAPLHQPVIGEIATHFVPDVPGGMLHCNGAQIAARAVYSAWTGSEWVPLQQYLASKG